MIKFNALNSKNSHLQRYKHYSNVKELAMERYAQKDIKQAMLAQMYF